MRIIGGTHRGTHLADVGAGDVGAHLRPTTDRLRETLFNVLQGGRFGDPLRGARVLDLFAGTGALGLEALSRGAAHASFVDNGRAALALIRANIAKLRRGPDTRVITTGIAALPPADQPCDLVFLDPPYGLGLGPVALDVAQRQGWIAAGALLVWEDGRAGQAPGGFVTLDQRRYGDTWLTWLRAPGP